jgi:hypothetical protein
VVGILKAPGARALPGPVMMGLPRDGRAKRQSTKRRIPSKAPIRVEKDDTDCRSLTARLKAIPRDFYPIPDRIKAIHGHFYPIADHLNPTADHLNPIEDRFYPIADHLNVIADGKKVIWVGFK